jgi:hypothetical protein
MASELHPSQFEIEAHHVGEPRAGVEAHLAGCGTCRGYLAALEAEAARFADRAHPQEFVRRIRKRAERGQRNRRSLVRLLVPSAALAAACVWLLVVSRPAALIPGPAGDAVSMKGTAQVAIILLQDGRQSRQLGSVEGKPGDRFRVEIATAAPIELEAVIIDHAGLVTPVTAAQRFAAGTHVLEPTFTFDSQPTVARLLVGPPAAIRRVLAGENLPAVIAIPIRSVRPR